MQLTGPSLWIAPLATGHPHGLPGAKRQEKQTTKVQPLDQARNPDAALTRGQTPGNFWKAVNGEPIPDDHIAPPTIMQLKISQMLDEQAQEMEAATPSAEEVSSREHSVDDEVTAEVKTKAVPDNGPTDKLVELSEDKPLPVTQPSLPAYEESASFSRKAVLSTLP